MRPIFLGAIGAVLAISLVGVFATAFALPPTMITKQVAPSTAVAVFQNTLRSPADNASNLALILKSQSLGEPLKNPIKHAIRNAVLGGVSIETIVLLLLLPIVVLFISSVRHLVGLRGFGIFFPAALGVVLLAVGPISGIILFLLIVLVSTLSRLFLRRLRLKLSYLPRMSLILWAVSLSVLGLLFAAPYISQIDLKDVSIFPVLILILLSEEFTRVQLGKNIHAAISLTFETLVLAILSFAILSYPPLQETTLRNPEYVLMGVLVLSWVLGRYTGLRLLELWRFWKLLRN